MKARSNVRQDGVSLSGLIMVLVVLALIGVIGMKIFPTVTEFMAVKKAIVLAKSSGSNPSEIRKTFSNTATIENIDSIGPQELIIVKSGEGYDVSFSYEKRIPLFGPASLLLAYQGTTAANGVVVKKKPEGE
jgi:cytoskeletal protein RodZ